MKTGSFVATWMIAAAGLFGCGHGRGHSVSTDASLADLDVSAGSLTPAFDPLTTAYTVGPIPDPVVTLTPTTSDPGATVEVAGTPVASGSASAPIALVDGPNPIQVVVTAEDGLTATTYTVVVTRIGTLAPEAYVKASDTSPSSAFGREVALDGDTLVVGADEKSSNTGSAYVYVRTGTTWAFQAMLTAPSPANADQFGTDVAISGDTIVVGSPGEDGSAVGVNGVVDESASNAGAAYVFVRSGTMWTLQAYLKASNTDAGDRFGSTVGISGDTIVVGTTNEQSNATGVNGNQSDDSFTFAGAAYVFVRSGTTWSQQAYLKASNTDDFDAFGRSVAISGDTIVVSALYEDSAASGVGGNQADDSLQDAGAAYVFVRSGTAWTQQAYLKATTPGIGDSYGDSVAVSGDTIVVGAGGEDGGATTVDGPVDETKPGSGAAYVYVRTGTAWALQAYLKAGNSGSNDTFGFRVDVSGDLIVVGAYSEAGSGTGVDPAVDDLLLGAGAAYVFLRTAGVWSQEAYVKATNTGSADFYGTSVAVSGGTIAVGAIGEDGSATGVGGIVDEASLNSGAVYVYR